MKVSILSLLLLGMTACSQEVPSVPAAPAPVAAPVPAVGPAPDASGSAAVSAPSDNKLLSVAIKDTDCASDPVAIAIVTWDARPAKATAVSIFIESPGNARKLWLQDGASGTASTDKWVFQNSRFTLTDKDSGRELASHLVDNVSCSR